MATALSVYVTSLSGSAATPYGFVVDAAGLGNATFKVGGSGAAFGIANGTSMRVLDLLQAADSAAVGGVLWEWQCAAAQHGQRAF
jgi:hypothetical protein